MDTINLALVKYVAINAGLLAIVQEIQPVKGEKVRSTKMPPNGSRSRVDRRAKEAKVKAKAKERKVATAIGVPNLCATIGARGMAIAATLLPATSLMTDLKEERKERGKEQRHYRRKPSRKQRKKSWQWSWKK
jgi:hypothetical protein